MFFDVADVDTPPLMPSQGFERVRLWVVWLFWGWLDPIELTILGHNAATGSWGNRDTQLLERRNYVDTSSPQQTHSDRSVEAAGSYNAALDLIHTALRAESEDERYTGVLYRPTLAFALRV